MNEMEDRPRTVAEVITAAGLDTVTAGISMGELEPRIRALSDASKGMDAIGLGALRAEAIRILNAAKVRGITPMIDATLAVKSADSSATPRQGKSLLLQAPAPWPDPVDGADLLNAISGTLRRYVVLRGQAPEALALWIVHSHAIDQVDISPILVITSPQKRCGKTTLLELLASLVLKPLPTANVSAASLFRAVQAFGPSMLVDEADTFLAEHDELRGIFNCGHTRAGAEVLRTVGDDHEPRVFSTFGAKAIAAIGKLPGTIEDRAIMVRMQRRTAGERVDRLRRDRISDQLEPLRRQVARWVSDHADQLRDSDPEPPSSLNDRAADNWRPLLAIADAAGGGWPEMARAAALGLNPSSDGEDNEAGVMLLGDLRDLFTARGTKTLQSAVIVDHLVGLESRPWPELFRGRPITTRGVAKLLSPFGIKPKTVRCGSDTAKGYDRADLKDAWTRYLSPGSGDSTRHTVTTLERHELEGNHDPSHDDGCDGSENPPEPLYPNGCDVVTDESEGSDWETVL